LTSAEQSPLITLVNSSEAVVDLLAEVFQQEGFRTLRLAIPDPELGPAELISLLDAHNPPVVLYDIAIPYDRNWHCFRLVYQDQAPKGRRFVVTTTNKRALEEFVGPSATFELIGKPYDLSVLVEAVRRELGPPR